MPSACGFGVISDMKELSEILVVEDDPTIRTLLEMALMGAGYRHVTSVGRGDEAWDLAKSRKPDLVLLDVMLPGIDGIGVASRIRANPELAGTKILMLTARVQPEDIVRRLDAGADDYVTKPFDRKVLLARIRSVLRRGLPVTEGVDFDGLVIDEAAKVAKLDGEALELTAGEFALLTRLVAHRGRIMQRAADERTVDVQIAKLRQKLGSWAEHIETVRGIGYRVK